MKVLYQKKLMYFLTTKAIKTFALTALAVLCICFGFKSGGRGAFIAYFLEVW